MAKISADVIFRKVKDEIFNLKNLGELEVPIVANDYTVPTEDDILKAYWQNEDKITVAYKGKKRLIPCPIRTKNDDYIARCIMQGFAQIVLNRNESKEGKTFSKKDALHVMENTITRLVNEGIMDVDDGEEENKSEFHSIHDNNDVIVHVLEKICGGYSHYLSCDVERYDAYVDFDPLYIIVSMNNDGYIYVSKVEGIVAENKQLAIIDLWREVSECIQKINGIGKKLTEL